MKPKCHSLNVVVWLHKESERLSSSNIRDYNPADGEDDVEDEDDEDDADDVEDFEDEDDKDDLCL